MKLALYARLHSEYVFLAQTKSLQPVSLQMLLFKVILKGLHSKALMLPPLFQAEFAHLKSKLQM